MTTSWPLMTVLVTQIRMALMVAQSSAARTSMDCGLDPCMAVWLFMTTVDCVDDQGLVSHLRPCCCPALYCRCCKGHTNPVVCDVTGYWWHPSWNGSVFGSVVLLQLQSVLMSMATVTTGVHRSCSCWNLWTVLSHRVLTGPGITGPAPHLTLQQESRLPFSRENWLQVLGRDDLTPCYRHGRSCPMTGV